VDYFPFDLDASAVAVNAQLAFEPGVDVDFFLLDPDGNTIGSGASLGNPEELSAYTTVPGTYQYKVVGYTTVSATYTLTSTATSYSAGSGAKTTVKNDARSDGIAPKEFLLEQNYPNPFNPATTISYVTPVEGKVQLMVYNMLGQEIATLVNVEQSPGEYDVRFDGTRFTSGVYYYKIAVVPVEAKREQEAKTFVSVRRMILVK
jgi:hypothetical protein